MLLSIPGLEHLLMNDSYLLELPDGQAYEYRITQSKRAKYIRLKLSNTGELSVTIPHKTALVKAHQFIKSKTQWIEKHLAKIPLDSPKEIPDKLDLVLLNELWVIDTVATDFNGVNLEAQPNFKLRVEGDIENADLVKKVINQWCKYKCKALFHSMLEEAAEEHGFHYKRLSIRSQKTRWGSCSSNKNINLNSKLLLMPEKVVKYVMIHELCHTVEMNHSKRFWALVKDCDPDYIAHKKILKDHGRSIFL